MKLVGLFLFGIFFTGNASASYLAEHLNTVESIETFKLVVEENTQDLIGRVDANENEADERVKVLLENQKQVENKDFAKKMNEYTLGSQSDVKSIYKGMREFINQPVDTGTFYSRVLDINLHYNQLVNQSDSSEVKEMINKERLVALDEYFVSNKKTSIYLKNRHQGRVDYALRKAAVEAEKMLSRYGIPTVPELVTYDNGNCDKFNVINRSFLTYNKLMEPSFIGQINKLNQLNDRKTLTFKCRITTLSSPSLKYSKRKHTLTFTIDIDSPLDPWERRHRYPKESLQDWLEEL